MNKIIIILFLIILAPGAIAQDYIFKVMANEGSNMSRSSSNDPWKQVKRGDELLSGYWVKIVDKAYLGLVHNTGKTTALQNPGEFTIEKIESSIKNKKKGLGAKYTDFVFNSMDSKKLIEEENIATRGAEEQIILKLPTDAEVIHSKVHLRWQPIKDYDDYVVTVKGIFDDVLTQVEVKGIHLVLDLASDPLKNEQSFIIDISVKGEESISSKEYIINRINDEEQKQMTQSPEESGLNTSMDYVLLAAYYEENNLLIDASNFYQEAMIQSPEVEDFKELYTNFLRRHNWH